MLGIILNSLFGYVDLFLDLQETQTFLMIRFGFVVPLVFIGLLFSFHASFVRVHQYVLTGVYMIVGLGIVAMVIIHPIITVITRDDS